MGRLSFRHKFNKEVVTKQADVAETKTESKPKPSRKVSKKDANTN